MLRFQRPTLPSAAAIERYLRQSREAGWLSNGGPCWQMLRDRLGARTGVPCVPVASGTAGLMAAVSAVRSGTPARARARQALLPSFTFPATAQAALWAGLTPRLLDVAPDHWHLAPDALEAALREHGRDVALVLAVTSFGTPPPPAVRRAWEELCDAAGVPLIVDSAAGFGAVAADGMPIGGQGDVEVVSFHATKPFAIGEGGAVFTRDPACLERIESAINFGLGVDRAVQIPLGFNGKMSELHAATALAVLDDFDAILDARRRSADALRSSADPALRWQQGCERSTWQFVPVAHPDPAAREAAARRARGRVETRSYYLPLHRMAAFRDLPRAGGLAATDALADALLCLPMANDLDAGELEAIASVVATAGRVAVPTGQVP